MDSKGIIPFTRPDLAGQELTNVQQCLLSETISGDGSFTERCHSHLESVLGCKVLLVHSCTAALEMAAILAGLSPGDEVIMPSYTFVSTANAVAVRGATPVFVDIEPVTLNIDPAKIDAAVTSKTRAILPVHYAGVGADMRSIASIAESRKLIVIEDAAQGYLARDGDSPLGAIGDMGCISFHVTKNVVSGEGGALAIKNPDLVQRAQIIREKGTNRTQFLRREVTKYEWLDIGSSYLPSDLVAAVLLAQLERAKEITERRMTAWRRYAEALGPLAELGFTLPSIPEGKRHNAHIFYFLVANEVQRAALLARLRDDGIMASSHYVPLHSAPGGRRFGRTHGSLEVTDRAASCIVRLPLFAGLTNAEIDRVIERTLYHARRL
ncbi:MAG: dTDP-4-amino-4,6-dideoxygalactose transaminase [Hyphomicrobium sp.]